MDGDSGTETGWLSLTWWLVIACATLLVIWLWKRCRVYSTFTQMGIPGPKPLPVLGNLVSFFKLGPHEFAKEHAKYGKVYGVYYMFQPAIHISDIDMTREILLKQFQCFTNRQVQENQSPPYRDMLTSLTDDHWKHVRSTLSPTFSTGKIKRMVPAIQRVLGTMTQYLKTAADNGEPLEVKEFFGRFALDVIAGAAFGLEVDSIHNPKEQFAKHASGVVNPSTFMMILRFFSLKLYKVLTKVFGMNAPFENAIEFFLTVTNTAIKEAIKEHQESKEKAQDFLQLLIEAENDGGNQGPVDAEINHGDQLKTSQQWKRKGLTTDEITANALLFFLVGYDTISTTLSFTLFCLVHNPECLRKAQEEVDEKLGKNMVNYDLVQDLTYIEMCVNETLRLYGPGFMLNRQANQDVEVCGLTIKKGTLVNVLAALIHMDPDIWPEPEKFEPLRHTVQARAARHPMAFIPFGMGPRNCIAMRLAQLEVRMALATVLQHFTPVTCDKTVYPPKLIKMKIEAVDGVWLKLQHRDN